MHFTAEDVMALRDNSGNRAGGEMQPMGCKEIRQLQAKPIAMT